MKAAVLHKVPNIAFFGVIFSCLLVCCTPDVTWSNGDLDLFDFLYAADALSVPHAPGLPLYVMVGWVVLRLPGNDAWLLSLFLSLIPTLITTFLIHRVIQRKTASSLLPYIGALTYPASFIVFSQSIIPEVYASTTMLIFLAYYLLELKRPRLAVVSLSAGCAITYLPLFAFLIMLFIYKEVRRHWYWIFAALPIYLFLFVAIREPFISTFRRDNPVAMYNFLMHHGSLFLSIPLWEIPERVYEYVKVFAVSFTIGLVPAVVGFTRDKKLFWLSFPFILYCITTLGPLSYWHLMPAVAFMSVAIALGLEHLPRILDIGPRKVYASVLLSGIVLLGMNAWSYDIGKNLDESPTAARIFLNDLELLEDNAVVVTWDATTYAGTFYYNHKNDKDLRAVLPLFRPYERFKKATTPQGDKYEYSVMDWRRPFDWEVDKYEEMGFQVYEYDEGFRTESDGSISYSVDLDEHTFLAPLEDEEHLTRIYLESIRTTTIFSEHHPEELIYAAVPNLDDKSRRGISLVKIVGGKVLGEINGGRYETTYTNR